MDVTRALVQLGGISNRAALLRLVPRRALERALAEGAVVRRQRGLYSLPVVDEAELAARRIGGVVSHLSAALAWGWKVKNPPARPTVTVPRNRCVAEPAATVRYAHLSSDEVAGRRTAPVRTAVDCARSLPFDEALSAVDSALRSQLVTRRHLLAAAEAGPRTGRSQALEVIAFASPKSANPFESVLRAIAREVPDFDPVSQGKVGIIGHSDVVDVELKIALEAESWEYHGLREAFEYYIHRYTSMQRTGWLVGRFTWDEVMHKPAYVRTATADLVAVRTNDKAVRATRP